MQTEAAEYIVGLAAGKYQTPPQTRVLSPCRAQVDLLAGRLVRPGNASTKVSTVDAAQGQEADLVIISFVSANSSGKVGFTDDARRLNVAITRAKAGVVIIGHLVTSLAASSSGFRMLLHDLTPGFHIKISFFGLAPQFLILDGGKRKSDEEEQ